MGASCVGGAGGGGAGLVCDVAEVVVLGSGSPIPDHGRGGSALAVAADGEWLLVDCGRAATQRAIDAGLDLTSVVAVAITHHHSDHISDLATFATARWTAGAATPLLVVAPAGPAARYAEQCVEVFDDQSFHAQALPQAGPRPTIDVHRFEAGNEPSLVFTAGMWRLSSVLVDHHPVEPAVGYLVELSDRRIAVSGDTAVCDGVRRLAQGADVLVHQAMLAGRVDSSLLEWNASARSLGELAAQTTPHTLVLTHLIPAPRSTDDENAYRADIRAGGFQGPTHIAYDGLRIRLGP